MNLKMRNSFFVVCICLFFSVLGQNNKAEVWGGWNEYGQLDVPVDLDSVIAVSSGLEHVLGLTSQGKVVAWGWNEDGQCDVPDDLDSVIAIEGGYYHSMALKSNGTVIAWGDNEYGQLNIPEGLDSIIAISTRNRYVLALKSNGHVISWGQHFYQGEDSTPIPEDLDSVIAVAAGTNHSLALKSNGTVVAWGWDTLTQVPLGLDSVVAIAAGFEHSIALRSNGSLVSWGVPGYSEEYIPEELTEVRTVEAGNKSSIALKKDGEVVIWRKRGGLVSLPHCLSNVKEIAIGLKYYVALTSPSFFAVSDKHVACDNYTWVDGITYDTNNNTATHTYIGGGINGCDSTILLDLTILKDTAIDKVTACNSFTWINGETYTSSTDSVVYVMESGRIGGCDSVIRLDLTIASIDDSIWFDGVFLNTNNIEATGYSWLNCDGNQIIDGETEREFGPVLNGTYAVVVEKGGCVDTSDCVSIIITGNDDINGVSFNAYPNPVEDVFKINFLNDVMATNIKFFDALGCLKRESSPNGSNVEIDISDFEKGIYFMELEMGGQKVRRKIIKQ